MNVQANPAEALWSSHAPPAGYPAGVVPVSAPIPGRAFFPGGYGLWDAAAGRALPDFPTDGVMVLGHDFHSESGYRESWAFGAERETMPTWRNLRALLEEVGIAPAQCFFTNLYMGLREGTATMGIFPGAADARSVTHCRRLLLKQLEVQRPKVVLTLGVHVPLAIGTLSRELEPWSQARGLKHLGAVGPVRERVTFEDMPGLETTAVALTHTIVTQACDTGAITAS